MAISTLAYLLGVVGGIGGLTTTVRDTAMFEPKISLVVLLVSIALLWSGFLIESIENNYGSLSVAARW
jgi:hypothetical protein